MFPLSDGNFFVENLLTYDIQQAIIKINQGGNYMIKIDKELLKRLLAIADAHDYLYEYRDVIECLKNDNSFDDVTVRKFLKETDKLTSELIRKENDEWSMKLMKCLKER